MSRLDTGTAHDTRALITPKWLTSLAIPASVFLNHANDELRPRRAVCFDPEVSAAFGESIDESAGKSEACSYEDGIHPCLRCTTSIVPSHLTQNSRPWVSHSGQVDPLSTLRTSVGLQTPATQLTPSTPAVFGALMV